MRNLVADFFFHCLRRNFHSEKEKSDLKIQVLHRAAALEVMLIYNFQWQ